MYQIADLRAWALVLNVKREYHSFFNEPKKDSNEFNDVMCRISRFTLIAASIALVSGA